MLAPHRSYAAQGASHTLPYRLSTSERARGLANRILFSRYYIIFYLVMTGLSLATVVLSLKEGDCPGTAWHILEIVVNGGMVLEVGTRWVGFGKVRSCRLRLAKPWGADMKADTAISDDAAQRCRLAAHGLLRDHVDGRLFQLVRRVQAWVATCPPNKMPH